MNTNPWKEDAEHFGKSARAVVISTRSGAAATLNHLPHMRKPIEAFIEDLDFIEAAYAKDDTVFRRNRALTSVHLPGIMSGLSSLVQMRADKVDEARLKAIEIEIVSCFKAAAQARSIIKERAVTSAEIEASVLRQAIAPQGVVPQEIATPVQTSGKSYLMGALSGSLDSLTKTGSKVFKDGRDYVTEIGSDAVSRVGAGTGLARIFLSGLVVDGIDTVTSPIARRMSAIGSCLTVASTGAVVGGLVSAIVFPPAVPFAIGLGLLAGTTTYSDVLEDEDKTSETSRKARQEQRAIDITAKMKAFRGLSPVVRMETPYVHVVMNAETGQSQGVVLTGRYAGVPLMDLDRDTLTHLGDTAPDDETKNIIHAWRDRMKPENSTQDSGENSTEAANTSIIGLGLDALIFSLVD